jgi:hypothetical protein
MKFIPSVALGAAALILSTVCSLGQSLQVYPAFELVFPTTTNVIYQLESSEDLTAWRRFGETIIGTGGDFSLLVSTRNTGPRFFRLAGPVTTEGLVAFYKFEGNASDWSTNGNHGVPSNVSLTTNRFGRADAAYRFSGASDSIIRVPNSPSLNVSNTLTLAAWVNFEPEGFISARILMKGRYNLAFADAGLAARRPGFIVQTPFEHLLLTPTPVTQAGKWYFIVGTYDESIMRLFIDGIQAVEMAATGNITPSASDLIIGQNSDNRTDTYKGIIDDIRIYNRALSPAEVLELFQETE